MSPRAMRMRPRSQRQAGSIQKPLSTNLGAVDHEALASGRPQATSRNPQGRFQLFRIGDAVAARNTHAAIYDALRLVKDL